MPKTKKERKKNNYWPFVPEPNLHPFVEKADKSLNAVISETERVETNFKGLLTFFGEDDNVQPEEFFAIPVKFSSDLKVLSFFFFGKS